VQSSGDEGEEAFELSVHGLLGTSDKVLDRVEAGVARPLACMPSVPISSSPAAAMLGSPPAAAAARRVVPDLDCRRVPLQRKGRTHVVGRSWAANERDSWADTSVGHLRDVYLAAPLTATLSTETSSSPYAGRRRATTSAAAAVDTRFQWKPGNPINSRRMYHLETPSTAVEARGNWQQHSMLKRISEWVD
jgi:hypothetical protein